MKNLFLTLSICLTFSVMAQNKEVQIKTHVLKERDKQQTSDIDKHLVIVYPNAAEGWALGNEFPIIANAYHSPYHATSSVVKLEYSLVKEGNTKEQWKPMTQNSDWNWHATAKISNSLNEQNLALTVKATLKDGHEYRKTTLFKHSLRTPYPFPPTGTWANLRGNAAHDSVITYQAAPVLRHVWIANVGGNIWHTAPIVAEGKVFIATVDKLKRNKQKPGFGAYAIQALDATTGKMIWEYSTLNAVKNTMVYANGKVVATDIEGIVYAIDANSGELIWDDCLLCAEKSPVATKGMLTDGATIFTRSRKGLSAMQASDGKMLWHITWQDKGESSMLCLGNNVLLSYMAESSFYGYNGFYGYDAQTGDLLWHQTGKGMHFQDGTGSFHDGKFHVASEDRLLVIDPVSGDIEHLRKTDTQFSPTSTPLVFEDALITGTVDSGLMAFYRNSFLPKWQVPVSPSLFYTDNHKSKEVVASPVLYGRHLYFGALDGFFYGVDIDTGVILWRIDLGAPVLSSVAIAGKMVFVADYSGNVHGFVIQDLI